MAAAVHDDDGVVRSESLYLIAPIVRVGETAVQKDDRRTVADARVIEADAVDLGVAGVLAGDRGRSGRQGLPQGFGTNGMDREKQQQGKHNSAHGRAPFIIVGWWRAYCSSQAHPAISPAIGLSS